eukprot:scaffold161496_cov47-Attheya_sp.AAC.1
MVWSVVVVVVVGRDSMDFLVGGWVCRLVWERLPVVQFCSQYMCYESSMLRSVPTRRKLPLSSKSSHDILNGRTRTTCIRYVDSPEAGESTGRRIRMMIRMASRPRVNTTPDDDGALAARAERKLDDERARGKTGGSDPPLPRQELF